MDSEATMMTTIDLGSSPADLGAFSLAVLRYEFRCAACRKIEFQEFEVRPGENTPRGTLPAGWTSIGESFFCADHKIRLYVDGLPRDL